MTPDKAIAVTTYREGAADSAAARAFYQKSGFISGQLTIEFGAPVQEFIWPADRWSALGE